MTEDRFRAALVKEARSLDWHAMFIGRARGGKAWVTQMGADGRGWPDLTLVRERIVFAELKTDSNYHVSEEERTWLDWLRAAGAEVYLWRPRNWPEIREVLERREPDRWARLIRATDGDPSQAAAVDRLLKVTPRPRRGERGVRQSVEPRQAPGESSH